MDSPKRLPSMVAGLDYLKSCGVPVDFILDVGVFTCTYPLISCFSDKKHYLIEPVRSFHANIAKIYTTNKIDFELIECAAGDSEDIRYLCEYAKSGGESITHSRIFASLADAPTQDLVNQTQVVTHRVDGLVNRIVAARNIDSASYNLLLKIDVDGNEEEVIAGAVDVMDRCSVVVIEAPISKLLKRSMMLEELGFQLVDIVDPCYYKGALSQVDCIFVRKNLIRVCKVDPWLVSSRIDFDHWYAGSYVNA